MDIQALKSLIDLFSQAPLQELDVSDGVQTLRITRGTAGHAVASGATSHPAPHSPANGGDTQHPSPPAHTPTTTQDHLLCAPLYGTLHLAPSPDAPPFVAIGDTLTAGQQVGLIEAMKVFTPVKATRSGQLQAILAEDGQEVEAEQPLMRLS